MAIAGRVAIVPKGDWSADATYKRLDAVTYNNTLYFAKKNVPAGTVTSNTEYWSKSIVGGAGGVATADEAGVVKPADGLTVAEDGTLKVSIDGTTLTMDQVNNVIKLADTLKDKINGAFPAANLINNLTTTEAGFGLDARQGKALDDKITEINGSLKMIDCGTSGFRASDLTLNIGDTISTKVKFNRTFDKAPAVVVSMKEHDGGIFFSYIGIDGRTVTSNGFEAIATIKHANVSSTWYFDWIAIST